MSTCQPVSNKHGVYVIMLLTVFSLMHSFVSVMGYTLLLSLIEYKTLVMRGDIERANEVLPSIPKEHLNRYTHLCLPL